MGEGAFDPYYTWLAIPPEQQPPDHYQLLGVKRFEENRDAISNAVDQRMAHLKTFQNGKRAQHSQALLNEISAAAGCLLDAKKKVEYDADLRANSDDIPTALPDDEPLPETLPDRAEPAASVRREAEPAFTGFSSKPSRSSLSKRRGKKNGALIWVGAGVVLAALALLLGVFFLTDRSGNKDGGKQTADGGKGVPPKKVPKDGSKSKRKSPKSKGTTKDRTKKKTARPPAKKLATVSVPANHDDLLNKLASHRPLAGKMLVEDGRLLLDASKMTTRVAMPYSFPVNYQLRCQFLRRKGGGPITFAIHVKDRIVPIVIDGYPTMGFYSGIESVGDVPVTKTGRVGSMKGNLLASNQIARVVISVIGNRIMAVCDRTKFVDWTGKHSALGTNPSWVRPQIVVKGGEFELHQLAVRSLPNMLTNVPNKKQTTEPNNKKTVGQNTVNPRPFGVPNATVQREDVPSAVELTTAKNEVMALYKQKLLEAKTPDSCGELCEELFKVAAETKAIAQRYVLLTESLTLAAKAKNLARGLEILKELETNFKIPLGELAYTFVRVGNSSMKTREEKAALAKVAIELAERVAGARAFARAVQCADYAMRAAVSSRDGDLRDEVRNQQRTIIQAKNRYDKAVAASAKLKSMPDDPTANLVWGKYLCYIEQDWNEGVKHLVKVDIPTLKKAAAMEVRQPSTPAETRILASAWQEAAQKETKLDRPGALNRAIHWYNKAAEQLSGLDKAAVESERDKLTLELAALGGKPTVATGRRIAGLMGSLFVDGRAASAPFHYLPGKPLYRSSVLDLVGQNTQVRNFRASVQGTFELSSAGRVTIRQVVGTNNTKGIVLIDRKPVPLNALSGSFQATGTIQLTRGKHRIEWQINGPRLHACLLEVSTPGSAEVAAMPVAIFSELPREVQESDLIRLDNSRPKD